MRVDGITVNNTTPSTVQVHNVLILDASGSMDGPKYQAACTGVQNELQLSKDLGFTFSLVEFVQSGLIITHCLKTNPEKVQIRFNGATGGNTPLYQTIVETLERLMRDKKADENFLIKILTDGQNNSGDKTASDCYKVIKQAEKKGFTVTFIAGEYDIQRIIREIGIDESNTQSHKNTGESITATFETQRSATISYSKRLERGEDVTFGFYSKVLND